MTLQPPLSADCVRIGSCTRALSACGNHTDIWAGLNRQGQIIWLVVVAHFLILRFKGGYLFTAWVHQAIERHTNDFPPKHKLILCN